MMKMKKILAAAAVFSVFVCACSFFTYAVDSGSESDEQSANQTDELYSLSGAEDIFESLDSETVDMFSDLDIDISEPSSVLSVSPSRVIASVFGIFTGKLAEPIKKCMVILGAVLLFAVIDSIAPTAGKIGDSGGMIFMMAVAFMVIAPVSECVNNALSAVKTISDFMKLLIPVLAGFAAASGKPIAAAAVSASSLGAAEAVGLGVDKFFVPIVGAYAAVCVVAAVNPLFNLQNIALFFRKVFTVVLGAVSVIFGGVLALQGSASAAADSLAYKGAKFLIGGLVPVVGGALSEGLTAAVSAVSVVGKTIGTLGIISIALIVIPPVLEILIWWASLYFCSLAATLLGQTQVSFYLSGVSNVIVMLNILLLFDAFVFITATGIVIGFAAG